LAISREGWHAAARYAAAMMARALPAALEASEGLRVSISSAGVARVLEHFRQRIAA